MTQSIQEAESTLEQERSHKCGSFGHSTSHPVRVTWQAESVLSLCCKSSSSVGRPASCVLRLSTAVKGPRVVSPRDTAREPHRGPLRTALPGPPCSRPMPPHFADFAHCFVELLPQLLLDMCAVSWGVFRSIPFPSQAACIFSSSAEVRVSMTVPRQ